MSSKDIRKTNFGLGGEKSLKKMDGLTEKCVGQWRGMTRYTASQVRRAATWQLKGF
jgi:hypothetical protein